MTGSNLVDFDFRAAIAEKNKFACRPVKQRPENAVDLATAKALSAVELEPSPQAVRLLIAVEDTDYRASLASLTTLPSAPECSAQPLSQTDAQILNAASNWTRSLQAIAIFSCYSKTAYSEVCSLGIRLIGSGLESEDTIASQSAYQAKKTEKEMLRRVADFCPTHIIMNTPNQRLLSWANRHHISSIVLVDDWQSPSERWQQKQQKQFVKRLNRPSVTWIGSRGFSACQAMANSGVASGKLIPWEWSTSPSLTQHSPKSLSVHKACLQLLYSGSLSEESSVRDLLVACSLLKQKEQAVALQLVIDEATPKSLLDALALQAQQLNIIEAITLVFARNIEQLVAQARVADVVVIPGSISGADNKSDLPLLIQVARAACTPIVACDRAELEPYLTHGVDAMIFPEGNAKSMVHRIDRLMGQPQLYAQLSASSALAASSLDMPIAWKELVEHWISDRPDNRSWLRNYAFLSSRYQVEPSVA